MTLRSAQALSGVSTRGHGLMGSSVFVFVFFQYLFYLDFNIITSKHLLSTIYIQIFK